MLLNEMTEYFKDVYSLQTHLQVYHNLESKYKQYFQLNKMVPEFIQKNENNYIYKKLLMNGDCPM